MEAGPDRDRLSMVSGLRQLELGTDRHPHRRVSDGVVDLGAEPAEIAAAVEWGEYELTVERTDGEKAATSTTFYAGWYAPADVSSTPDTLELVAGQTRLSAG